MKIQREGDAVVLRMNDQEVHRLTVMLKDIAKGYDDEGNEQGVSGDPGLAEAFLQDAEKARALARALEAKMKKTNLGKADMK